MNPVLKYRGGKSKEISHFLKYIPTDYGCYFEPFLGGGAVFFHLEPQRAVINDVNSRLMQFYSELRDSYPTMREQLDAVQKMYEENQADFKKRKALAPDQKVPNGNEELYYHLRDLFNHQEKGQQQLNLYGLPDNLLPGVIYFFINKTAYSGMLRFNAAGEYNVPFGRYPNLNTQLVTEAPSRLLQNAKLLTWITTKSSKWLERMTSCSWIRHTTACSTIMAIWKWKMDSVSRSIVVWLRIFANLNVVP